jgi:uncharacterized protein
MNMQTMAEWQPALREKTVRAGKPHAARRVRCAVALVLLSLGTAARAQNEAAPAAAAALAQKEAAPAAATTPAVGQGAGYHDPRSPFKPIEPRTGVVSWPVLSSVTTRVEKNRVIPVFPQSVQSLNNQTVKLEGFMMPLEPGEKQRHFLLSSVPTTCSFCVPAGPEGLVEVRSRTPVKYTLEPVTVEGKLAVLDDDQYGLFYRIVDAKPIP